MGNISATATASTRLQPPTWEQLLRDNPGRSTWYEDDADSDVYALFILEEVPIDMIDQVLRRNYEDAGDWHLWLADDPESLPDFTDMWIEGTHQPIDEDWRSPGLGASMEEVVEFIQSIPKPPKSVSKLCFVVLDPQRYEEFDEVLVCKIVGQEVQCTPCEAGWVSTYLVGHQRDRWQERWKAWSEGGQPL